MTYTLTNIVSNPEVAVTGELTTFTPITSGTGISTINWIIRPSLDINNQMNGGTWGGGRSFFKMSCEFIITDA